jgi:hypothetical protein
MSLFPSEGILGRKASVVNGQVKFRSHSGALCPDIIATVAAGNRETPSQFVPKNCQEYQNISKDIELYRNTRDP